MGDDTIKKNISKNIAKYRESAGLSQKELANKLGVVPSRISNWETGANCPTIDILFEVCEVLGVSINDIYGVYPDSKFVLKYGEQELLKNTVLWIRMEKDSRFCTYGRSRSLLL